MTNTLNELQASRRLADICHREHHKCTTYVRWFKSVRLDGTPPMRPKWSRSTPLSKRGASKQVYKIDQGSHLICHCQSNDNFVHSHHVARGVQHALHARPVVEARIANQSAAVNGPHLGTPLRTVVTVENVDKRSTLRCSQRTRGIVMRGNRDGEAVEVHCRGAGIAQFVGDGPVEVIVAQVKIPGEITSTTVP